MQERIEVRALIACVASLAAAWILTEVVWGATCGLVGGLAIKGNPEYQQKALTFLQDTGINTNVANASEMRAALAKLTPEEREEFNRMTRDAMGNVSWFGVTLFVSVIVFGGVGLLSGIIARSWVLAPLILALSFLLNNPIVRFWTAKELAPLQKTIVIVVQFVACSGLALVGARLMGKRKRDSQQISAANAAPPQS